MAAPITFSPASVANQTFSVNRPITTLTMPAPSRGTVSMPVVPLGLSFDPNTRRLSGTPLLSRSLTDYPYIATDGDHYAVLNQGITVEKSSRPDTSLNGSQFMIKRSQAFTNAMGAVVPEVDDNDYATFSTETVLNVDTAISATQGAEITHAWLKCKNVVDWELTVTTGTGTGFANHVIPSHTTKYEGGVRSTTVSGFSHEMYEFDTPLMASEIQLQFTGSNIEIYDVMLLEQQYLLDANSTFVDVEWMRMDRTGGIHENSRGDAERYAPVGANRHKWDVSYVSVWEDDFPDEFLQWLEDNGNFIIAPEYTRYPNRVFRCFHKTLENGVKYRSQVTSAGVLLDFVISEA